jgi:chemotaxis protein histidine kinase CheA
MLTVRDVTKLRALQAEADQQRQELSMIGEIIELDSGVFQNVCERSLAMAREAQALVNNYQQQSDTVERVFRILHTIKGNARMQNLSVIVECAHEAEAVLDQCRKHPITTTLAPALAQAIKKVETAILQYQKIALHQLGRGQGSFFGRHQRLEPQVLDALNEKLHALCDRITDEEVLSAITQAADLLDASKATRLDKLIRANLPAVASLARELEKPTPQLIFVNTNIYIKNEVSDLLQDVLMHLLRNALDHGIEAPTERREKCKSEQGKILITSHQSEFGLTISVEDDGEGLSLQSLRNKAEGLGINWEDSQSISEILFAPGFSTKTDVTAVSGRGVGLDVVKSHLKACGGDVSLAWTSDSEEECARSFRIDIRLPNDAFFAT